MFKDNDKLSYNQNIILSNIFEKYRIYLYRVSKEEFFASTYLKLIYVIKGSVTIEFENTNINLETGDIFYIGPNLCYKIMQDEGIENTMLILDILPSYIEHFCNECFDMTIPYNLNDYKDDIVVPMGEVYLLTLQHNLSNIEALISQIISKLNDSSKRKYTYSDDGSAKNIVYEVACYIKKNIDEISDNNILLSDIAEHFDVSYYYLSRNFKDVTGLNYSDFILKYKLNIAVSYLINTKDKISDIASISGFNDSKSFNHSFKNNFKLTPSEFRQKYKNFNINIHSDGLHSEEDTKLFFFEIRNFHNKYFKSKIDLSYGIDLSSSNTLVYNSDENMLDLNNIIDVNNNLSLLSDVFESPFVNNIIINIALVSNKLFLIDKNERLLNISLLEFKHLITSFNRNNCNILLTFNYKEGLNYVTQDSIVQILRFIESTIGDSLFSNYSYGLRINNTKKYIRDNDFKFINNCINLFYKSISLFLNSNSFEWVFYIEDLKNVEDAKSLKGFKNKISKHPNKYILGYNYNHSMVNYKKAIDYYLSLTNAINEIINPDNKQKIIVGFNYDLTSSDTHKAYTVNYATLFSTALFFTFKKNGYNVAYLDYEKLNDGKLDKLPKFTHNALGLKNPEYLITYLVKSLGRDILLCNDGLFVTRNKNDLYMLVYDDYSGFYNYVSYSSIVNLDKTINYRFDLKNISGKYKLVEYTFSISRFSSNLTPENLINISEEDFFLLSLANKSDIFIDFIDIDDGYTYTTTRNILEYKFIKLQKIY